MSPRNRAALVAATLAVMIALFVLLRPTDDRSDDESPVAETTTTQVEVPAATTGPSGATAVEVAPPAKPKPAAPKFEQISVKGLEPADGVTKLKADKGDTVRFAVSSDQKENVHLHGYDVEKSVGPGKPARFTVKADIEGIFEIELEDSAVEIAQLTVQP